MQDKDRVHHPHADMQDIWKAEKSEHTFEGRRHCACEKLEKSSSSLYAVPAKRARTTGIFS
jgi:hypothetical protein